MASIDRTKLLQTLTALPPQQFSQIEFALKPPDGIMPGITAPLGDRAIALLNWAEGPTGPGIDRVAAELNRLGGQRQPSGIPNNLPRSGAVKFVGREADLANLHIQLHQSDRLAITALRGMGGIGKTELALQYAIAHRDQGTYPGGICWLQAKEQDMGTEIVTFASDYLGLTVPTDIDLPRQAQLCWRNWPSGGDVLVVIDDVSGPDDNAAYAAIKPYLPPQESRFRVLLTTRLQLGASIHTVQIDVLSKAASLELLRSLVGTDRVNQELDTAKVLCEWLGYLPLGLELVGRFLVRKPTWSLAKMQQRLNDKRLAAKALCQAHPDMTAAHESLATAFELSWQDLEPEAQELAYRLSLYALAPIDWQWIEQWYKGTDPDDLEDWRDEGLVNRSLLTGDSNSDTWQLHQIIREFFRTKLDQCPEGAALKQNYCQRMVQVAKGISDLPTRNQILAVTAAIPHLVEAATTWQAWIEDESLGRLFTGLEWFYEGQSSYEQAEPWHQMGLKAKRERLGDDHPGIATSLNNLAGLYQMQGRYSEAEPLYQEALAMKRRLVGYNHPDIATGLNNLAMIYQEQGRYREAEPLMKQALKLMKQFLGEAHPDVATSMNNLAMLYQSQGRYNVAEPLLQETLALHKQLLGDDHPGVATSMNNLAMLYRSQGRYREAEPLSQEALTLYKQLLGDDHPHVATSLFNLGVLRYKQGFLEAAKSLLLEALPIYEATLGPAHPNTQNLKGWIARVRTALDAAD